VEHPDWARILCAERNALGTVQSYALSEPEHLFLTCDEDPEGTPCGACRQLLVELAPDTTLWMDRHSEPPEQSTISALLPGSFRGHALLDTS
jgi:cytidine deaminase